MFSRYFIETLVRGQFSILGTVPFVFLFLAGCATTNPVLQPQINSLIAADMFDEAVNVLNTKIQSYGPKNELLYLMDKAYVLHITRHYQESIDLFEKAQRKFDELYTKSLRNIAATWIINDNVAPYRGEDFEHVLVNIFQALNYAAIGNLPEALVEARDVDLKLNKINDLYKAGQKNVYREDAFARLLMGILYEATDNQQDLNDAFISYKKALEIYERDYRQNYKMSVPIVLIENLLAAAEYFDEQAFQDYRKSFPNVPFVRLKEKKQKAEIYLIQYNGLAPIKHPAIIPIPLPGTVTQLAFPTYDTRYYEISSSTFQAVGTAQKESKNQTELGQDIEAIARQSLANRKMRIYAKAVARPAAKYLAERKIISKTKEHHGDIAAIAVSGLSIWYNLYSEQADLRSWQTLPAQIRIARLIVEPGDYELSLNNFNAENIRIDENNLGKVNLKAGEKKFIIIRTVR